MTAHLTRIDMFPIKALDGISVSQATVLESGALQGDRTYALVDGQGQFINGKRTAAIHAIRASFTPDGQIVTLERAGGEMPCTGHLEHHQDRLNAWFSDYFQQPVTLQRNLDMGFPDDTVSPGPTLVSRATLAAIASWYPDLSLESVRQQFRTNLEIDGVPAFWEDRLFGRADPVPFRIGAVEFLGINPCQRCVVPTRHPQTGVAIAGFQKTFSQQRAATLPDWASRERFNHFYRVAVNTRLSPGSAARSLQVGDRLSLG